MGSLLSTTPVEAVLPSSLAPGKSRLGAEFDYNFRGPVFPGSLKAQEAKQQSGGLCGATSAAPKIAPPRVTKCLPDDAEFRGNLYLVQMPTTNGRTAAQAGGGRCGSAGTEAKWYFYNDMISHYVKIVLTLGPFGRFDPSNLKYAKKQDDGTYVMYVFPATTLCFGRGDFCGYDFEFVRCKIDGEDGLTAKTTGSNPPSPDPVACRYLTQLRDDANEIVHDDEERVEDIGLEVAYLVACVRAGLPFVSLTGKDGHIPKYYEDADGNNAWLRPEHYLTVDELPKKTLIECVQARDVAVSDKTFRRGSSDWLATTMAALADTSAGYKIYSAFGMQPGGSTVPGTTASALTKCLPCVASRVAQMEKEQRLGGYRLMLCKNGWWEEGVVDDYLPCDGPSLRYCYNRSQRNELWPSLMEKGVAKSITPKTPDFYKVKPPKKEAEAGGCPPAEGHKKKDVNNNDDQKVEPPADKVEPPADNINRGMDFNEAIDREIEARDNHYGSDVDPYKALFSDIGDGQKGAMPFQSPDFAFARLTGCPTQEYRGFLPPCTNKKAAEGQGSTEVAPTTLTAKAAEASFNELRQMLRNGLAIVIRAKKGAKKGNNNEEEGAASATAANGCGNDEAGRWYALLELRHYHAAGFHGRLYKLRDIRGRSRDLFVPGLAVLDSRSRDLDGFDLLRKDIALSESTEGTFWVRSDASSFFDQFDRCVICHLRTSWLDYRFRSSILVKPTIEGSGKDRVRPKLALAIRVAEPTEAFLSFTCEEGPGFDRDFMMKDHEATPQPPMVKGLALFEATVEINTHVYRPVYYATADPLKPYTVHHSKVNSKVSCSCKDKEEVEKAEPIAKCNICVKDEHSGTLSMRALLQPEKRYLLLPVVGGFRCGCPWVEGDQKNQAANATDLLATLVAQDYYAFDYSLGVVADKPLADVRFKDASAFDATATYYGPMQEVDDVGPITYQKKKEGQPPRTRVGYEMTL